MNAASSLLAVALLLVVPFQAIAQQRAGLPPDSNAAATAAENPSFGTFHDRGRLYRLHESDVIEVDFNFSPEFNQTVTVQPDGHISLKGTSEVLAANKTLHELTDAIKNAYRGVLHDPVVTVSLKDFDKPFFLASGQVGRPGKYELRSDTTLTEALAIAGGFTSAAKHSQVVLFRRVSSETVEARVFNVKHMLNSRNLQEDPHLVPGDMLYVPQNKWSKVRQYLPTTSMGVYANPNPL
jgi:polysaccharide export outer membrane protein